MLGWLSACPPRRSKRSTAWEPAATAEPAAAPGAPSPSRSASKSTAAELLPAALGTSSKASRSPTRSAFRRGWLTSPFALACTLSTSESWASRPACDTACSRQGGLHGWEGHGGTFTCMAAEVLQHLLHDMQPHTPTAAGPAAAHSGGWGPQKLSLQSTVHGGCPADPAAGGEHTWTAAGSADMSTAAAGAKVRA